MKRTALLVFTLLAIALSNHRMLFSGTPFSPPPDATPPGTFRVAAGRYWDVAEQINQPGAVSIPLPDPIDLPFPEVEWKGPHFVGKETCLECHEKTVRSQAETAHARTTVPAHTGAPPWALPEEGAWVNTADPALRFHVWTREGRMFQTAEVQGAGTTHRITRESAIRVGSGKVGQSFLFREQDRLFQLPVSWLRETRAWVNSPGYIDGSANFSRPITVRCMECHSTYIRHDEFELNHFHPEEFFPGIQCEKCHGPASDHVAWHRAHPEEKEPHAILQPGNLSRERMNMVCAFCHTGIGINKKPPFTFRAGMDVHEFLDLSESDGGEVHTANQYVRLQQSRCYTESGTMTCITCHDPHQEERGKLELFSERCLKCHTAPRHDSLTARQRASVNQNCISCHMPKQEDTSSLIETAGEKIFPKLRDHLIKVYPLGGREADPR